MEGEIEESARAVENVDGEVRPFGAAEARRGAGGRIAAGAALVRVRVRVRSRVRPRVVSVAAARVLMRARAAAVRVATRAARRLAAHSSSSDSRPHRSPRATHRVARRRVRASRVRRALTTARVDFRREEVLREAATAKQVDCRSAPTGTQWTEKKRQTYCTYSQSMLRSVQNQ